MAPIGTALISSPSNSTHTYQPDVAELLNTLALKKDVDAIGLGVNAGTLAIGATGLYISYKLYRYKRDNPRRQQDTLLSSLPLTSEFRPFTFLRFAMLYMKHPALVT